MKRPKSVLTARGEPLDSRNKFKDEGMWNNSRRDEKLAWVAPMGRRGAWWAKPSASKLNTESVGHVEKMEVYFWRNSADGLNSAEANLSGWGKLMVFALFSSHNIPLNVTDR